MASYFSTNGDVNEKVKTPSNVRSAARSILPVFGSSTEQNVTPAFGYSVTLSIRIPCDRQISIASCTVAAPDMRSQFLFGDHVHGNRCMFSLGLSPVSDDFPDLPYRTPLAHHTLSWLRYLTSK